jgi:hypothetical protein
MWVIILFLTISEDNRVEGMYTYTDVVIEREGGLKITCDTLADLYAEEIEKSWSEDISQVDAFCMKADAVQGMIDSGLLTKF